jgi:hypothetical protein
MHVDNPAGVQPVDSFFDELVATYNFDRTPD